MLELEESAKERMKKKACSTYLVMQQQIVISRAGVKVNESGTK